MKVARVIQELGFVDSFAQCPFGNPTGMRVWAYKTGLIKPRSKPERPALSYAQAQTKTIQQLRREAAIANGEPVALLALDQETKDKIDEDVRERADNLGLVDADKRKFEKLVRDALRKVVQEGRSYKEKCDVEQRKLINQEVARRVAITEERLQKEKNEAERFRKHYEELINRHKPIFTTEEYRNILRGLHEDSSDPTNRRDAFSIFNAQKFRLTGVR
jgi:hypothetical protein